MRSKKLYAYQKRERHLKFKNEAKQRREKFEKSHRTRELEAIQEEDGSDGVGDYKLGYRPTIVDHSIELSSDEEAT